MTLPAREAEPGLDPGDEAIFSIALRRMRAMSAQRDLVARYLRVRFPEDDQP